MIHWMRLHSYEDARVEREKRESNNLRSNPNLTTRGPRTKWLSLQAPCGYQQHHSSSRLQELKREHTWQLAGIFPFLFWSRANFTKNRMFQITKIAIKPHSSPNVFFWRMQGIENENFKGICVDRIHLHLRTLKVESLFLLPAIKFWNYIFFLKTLTLLHPTCLDGTPESSGFKH